MFLNLLFSLLLVTTLAESVPSSTSTTKSFMSDKTEVEVDLEVSGAEALCETEDGYVWIAQYSGLTRYDSREYVTYKDFTEDDKKYDIINVRTLAAKGNTLYVATNKNIFVYEDYQFSYINVEAGVIRDLALDEENDLLSACCADAAVCEPGAGRRQLQPEQGRLQHILYIRIRLLAGCAGVSGRLPDQDGHRQRRPGPGRTHEQAPEPVCAEQ